MSTEVDTGDYEPLTLVFLVGGQAVLEEGEGDDADIIWSSDDDDDFREYLPIDFLTYENAASIIDYLIEEDIVDESDREDIAIDIESYDAEDIAGTSAVN